MASIIWYVTNCEEKVLLHDLCNCRNNAKQTPKIKWWYSEYVRLSGGTLQTQYHKNLLDVQMRSTGNLLKMRNSE